LRCARKESELPRVSSLSYPHFGLFGLGYPDRAWAKSREMLEVAQRSSNSNVLALASCYAAEHNLIRGDGTAAQKCAEEAMALTEKMGFVSFSAMAITWHGAALIAQGYEEGIAGTQTIAFEAALPTRCPPFSTYQRRPEQ
jgi:hypothetical protein